MPNSASSSRTCGATHTASEKSVPGCGSRSMRIWFGDSTSVLSTGHGWNVSVPRLAHHATTATESGAISSAVRRSEEHTSELQSRQYLVCRLLLEKKKRDPSPTA